MKVKAFVGIAGLGALAVALSVTNPSQDQYNTFAADTLQNEVRSSFCQAKELDSWLGDLGKALGDLCETAIEQGRVVGQEDLEDFIEDNTQRQNFWVFSLYTTQIPAVRVKTLGIFNRFIPIQQTVG
ncbi:DUF4359 domain-containing protein [Leptolyngbya cf. ectocarpi LEGE 11479]|uniref:DUF4359 domain-containing protein n=1 Tax=Leptolyngbya cf. ectocarpi LEGE 11479 TaxID=1828722 RepID=A0A928X1W0_LEPEC|nr:DUF4359 domain-containing protein [Leptolyngbya ectocarpi]MBE9066917.1 DUF4359 domain-containing protein [Leptolyngbya cf. ectocarpi LEGE 11479]